MPSDRDKAIEAMGHREVIGEAVELLKAEHHVSEAVAFEMLVRNSSASHELVREVAVTIVQKGPGRNPLVPPRPPVHGRWRGVWLCAISTAQVDQTSCRRRVATGQHADERQVTR